MRTSLKEILTLALIALSYHNASAHDFEIGGIFYNITSETDKIVEVTYQGSSVTSAAYTGSIVIPETVRYGGNQYSVTSIGKIAFGNCRGLTTISIPNSVTSIGSYAFLFCIYEA